MSLLGKATASRPTTLATLLRETAEPFDSIEHAELGPLLDRIGDAPVVLLGEASHGSSEFYRMRARVTQELIRQRGFDIGLHPVAAGCDGSRHTLTPVGKPTQ